MYHLSQGFLGSGCKCMYMSQAIEEGDDEMTELEREVVYERMEDIEDEESSGDIDELIERI